MKENNVSTIFLDNITCMLQIDILSQRNKFHHLIIIFLIDFFIY